VTELAIEESRDAESVRSDAVNEGGRQALILHRILQVIAKNHNRPVSVRDIAKESGMTREYAMRVFVRATGTTIHEYLLRYRIAAAQRLLATGDAKIGAIAQDSGFSSVAPFYAAFHRICGQSPQRYRAAIYRTTARKRA
jgi:AraC-like DNA-binding protein